MRVMRREMVCAACAGRVPVRRGPGPGSAAAGTMQTLVSSRSRAVRAGRDTRDDSTILDSIGWRQPPSDRESPPRQTHTRQGHLHPPAARTNVFTLCARAPVRSRAHTSLSLSQPPIAATHAPRTKCRSARPERGRARAARLPPQSSSIASRWALASASACAWSSGGTSWCMRSVSSLTHEISSSIGLSFAGSCCE